MKWIKIYNLILHIIYHDFIHVSSSYLHWKSFNGNRKEHNVLIMKTTTSALTFEAMKNIFLLIDSVTVFVITGFISFMTECRRKQTLLWGLTFLKWVAVQQEQTFKILQHSHKLEEKVRKL